MSQTVAKRLPDLPRKFVAARMDAGETDRKPLADEQARAVLGRSIEAALLACRISKQEASHRMGYGTNQAPLSRWIAGTEAPQLLKLWLIGVDFQTEWVFALGRECRALDFTQQLTRRVTA